ncbi:hypothetical protein [Mycolicibacterium rhodesiae]|uniref:hypothetical protein n=1 Tax=Mycolicibacterium rhodesiae TaxID=36814 RepID=UPI00059BCE22
MRLWLAMAVATCGLVVAQGTPATAVPGVCPPICDAIPDSAWIAPTAVPLYPVYRWPALAGLAVRAPQPRFTFEEVCASPPLIGDARDYAVAWQATVPNPPGQWQLRAQIVHWRGDTAHFGPTATDMLDLARTRLRDCQLTAPRASPSITTSDPFRLAAVISVPGKRVVHQYLLAHPSSSTVVELALWSTLTPLVPWPAVPDAQVFDAMAAPLCDAYLGSCR